MTGFTQIAGGNVGTTFAAGIDAIMATETIIDNIDMINGCRYPCGSRVTGAAIFRGGYVVHGLARGPEAIMAKLTGAQHLRMIHRRYRRPGLRAGLMTGITHIGGRQMVIGFTAGQRPIMTVNTGTDDLGVIHSRGDNGCPGGRGNFMT